MICLKVGTKVAYRPRITPDELSDRATALQALMGSLATDALSSENAVKLSEKFQELMGGASTVDQTRNERGEVGHRVMRL